MTTILESLSSDGPLTPIGDVKVDHHYCLIIGSRTPLPSPPIVEVHTNIVNNMHSKQDDEAGHPNSNI
jgi:hypothetical protein